MRQTGPQRFARLVRDLARFGYGIHPLEEVQGDKRMSTNDVKGLAGLVNDEVRKLQQHTMEVRDRLQNQLKEAHDVVTHVGDMSDALGSAVAELKASLGQHTNGPPVDSK